MKRANKWLSILGVAALAVPALALRADLVCSETGKVVAQCCCKQQDGKFVCQETGKTFDKCCCVKK